MASVNDPNFVKKPVRIPQEDLKYKYRGRSDRIKAYCGAIEKVGETKYLKVTAKEKDRGTIEFMVEASPPEAYETSFNFIVGEFCKYEERYKYYLASVYGRGKSLPWKSGPRESAKPMSKAKQRLTIAALREHDKQTSCELRQIACGPCDHFWWRTVLITKRVSKCRECNKRYDVLPRDKEFGIGRFLCEECDNEFFAKCEATDKRRCLECGHMVSDPYIHPKFVAQSYRPSSRSTRNRDREAQVQIPPIPQPQFIPLSVASLQIQPGPAVYYNVPVSPQQPPKQPPAQDFQDRQQTRQRKPRVVNASNEHIPTGSTVSTFLTQWDELSETVSLTYDSDGGVIGSSDESDEEEIPDEDKGVGACKFKCECGNEFTVLCEMTDTAQCFGCNCQVSPDKWNHPRKIDRAEDSTYKHSCSKCNGQGNCPNLH